MGEEPLKRWLSISIAILLGGILASLYELIFPWSTFDLKSLVLFVTIPALVGFIFSYMAQSHMIGDAWLVGLIVGTINVLGYLVVASLIEEIQLTREEVPATFFFVLMSIIAWMLITSTTAYLGKQMKE